MLRPWALILSGFVGGLSVYLLVNLTPVGNAAQGAPPNLSVDSTPLSRETKLASSFAPVIKKASPSVVNIYTKKEVAQEMSPLMNDPFFRRFFGIPEQGQPGRRPSRLEQSLGSGVIVSEDGYILTNNHVVDGADEIKVVLPNQREELDARIIGSDPRTDVAVLKVDATGLPAMILSDSDLLEVGDVVLAIGNPFALGQTVTMGIVSATGRGGFGVVDYEDFIQTDASINRGNSGGALVDAQGRLVGINTFIISGSGGNVGVGFAIPINMARNVMNLLIRDGRVARGYLGVQLQPEITPDLAKALNLSDRSGALIVDVGSDTPADKAGLKPNDLIVEFNKRSVQDRRQLQLMVSQTPPSTEAELKIIRDGKEQNVKVTLGDFPSELADSPLQPGAPGTSDILGGVEVADLTPELRQQFNIPRGVQGALVASVEPNSPAYREGLRPGNVILDINRSPVTNARDATRLSRQARDQTALLRVWTSTGSKFILINLTAEQR
jgi:serine protease Do